MSLTRREFVVRSTGLVIAASTARRLLAQGAAAPQQAPVVTPVFTPIRGNIGFFTGRGGTIGYLINDKGVVVVDSQYPDSAALCLAGLQERSKNRGVDLLINTHHHVDHTGGNPVFKPVAKHIVANARAAELQQQVYDAAVKTAYDKGTAAPAAIAVADVAFSDTWSSNVGDEKIAAKTYTPAHTSGDAVVVFEKANVVHTGDLMFNRIHPVIDRPAGANIANWIVKIEQVTKDHGSDTTYIFGHSNAKFPPTGSREDLLYMRDYLTALMTFVKAQMAAGKSRDEIVAMTDTLKGFEDHGPLIARATSNAYDELAAK